MSLLVISCKLKFSNADHDFCVTSEIPKISPPSMHERYIEGSSVNITCSAIGKPDPEVSWIRNGQIQSSGRKTASLNFDQIKRTDDGLYTCSANNSAGKKVRKEILVVLCESGFFNIKSWLCTFSLIRISFLQYFLSRPGKYTECYFISFQVLDW